MPRARHWIALPLFLALTLISMSAFSQTVTVPKGQKIQRDQPLRDDSRKPAWINYDDCINDDVLYIVASVSTTQTGNLDVWAGEPGTDCTAQENRTGSSPTCWLVYRAAATSGNSLEFPIRAQDIVAQRYTTNQDGSGPGSGTIEDCENGLDQTALELNFLLVSSAGNTVASSAKYTATGVDVAAPTAPTDMKASNEENSLRLSWTPGGESDLLGYDFFCDETAPAPVISPSLYPLQNMPTVDGSTGAGGAAADAMAPGAGGASVTLRDGGGALDSGTTATTPDSGASAGNPACPSDAVAQGERPDPDLKCGGTRGRTVTGGRATGLANGATYAVAMAGVDAVGNLGRLSNVECGTPEVINDFYELYKAAGGEGGGGFCSTKPGPAPWALGTALVATAIALTMRRRRRR